MDLFVAWQTSFDDEDPKLAVLADDAEALRRKNQSMDAAKRIIESWLLRVGGQTIDFNGGNGHCQVPADELSDLERIRAQYSQTIGDVRVAMGVGIKLSEADLALKTAIKQGADKIVLYTPDASGHTEEAAQGLNKAVPGMNTGAGGFSGASRPMAPSVAKPLPEGSEHSQAEAEASLLANAPPPAELTHSAADAEEAFRAHADQADEDEKSQDEASGKAGADNDLKQEVLKVLQGLKSQSQVLGQVAVTEPKLFAVIQESIKAMLLLAKRLCGTPETGASQPVTKSEGGIVILMSGRPEETSAKASVPPPEAQWGYHIVSEWDNLDDIAKHGLRPRAEEGTATLHFTTDFDSVKEREGDILRFQVPIENSPNPYRPDKPSERITTSTIPPESLQLCSQWRKLEIAKSEKEWFSVTQDPIIKSDSYFRHPAFLGKNGQVVATPGFHDIDSLPADFEIAQEGYVSGDGTFYDRKTAEEMATPIEPVKKAEPAPYDSRGRRKSAAKIEEEFEEDPDWQRSKWLAKRTPEDSGLPKPLPVQHFSTTPGLKVLDPKFQGTGSTGPEKNRTARIPRTYLYTDPGQPEAHVASGSHRYQGSLPPGTRLYDMGKDHLGLLDAKMKQTRNGQIYQPADLDVAEKKLKRLGYHGFHNYGVKDALAYFHPLPVKPLVKSWPKDAKENEANTHANAIAQDHFMDQGATREEVQPEKLQQDINGKYDSLFHPRGEGRRHEQVANAVYGSRFLNAAVPGNHPQGYVTVNSPSTPAGVRDSSSGFVQLGFNPSDSREQFKNAKQNDHLYWMNIFNSLPHDPLDKHFSDHDAIASDAVQEGHPSAKVITPTAAANSVYQARAKLKPFHQSIAPAIEANRANMAKLVPPNKSMWKNPVEPSVSSSPNPAWSGFGSESWHGAEAKSNDTDFWRALNDAVGPTMIKKLPLPENAPKNTHHEYPIGAVKDHSPQGSRDVGKVKVRHDDGKSGWVEVRAGQVMSSDGHAISSRNPGGK